MLKEKSKKLKQNPEQSSLERDKVQYKPMLQGKGTNDLAMIYLDKEPQQIDLMTGLATVDKGENFALTIDLTKTTGNFKLVASTQKLLDVLAIAFTEQTPYRPNRDLTPNEMSISYPIKQLTKDLGKDPNNKNDVDNIRKKVNKDLDNLYRVSLNWTEPNSKDGNYRDVRVISEKGIRDGNIDVQFTPRIANYLANAYVMNYPTNLLSISCQQTPLPFYIGRKLALHHSINHNKELGTANIIGVNTLIEQLTKGGLLETVENVKASRHSLYQMIIEPIEKALDSLVANKILIDWCYCEKNKQKFTDERLAEIIGDYQKTKDVYILFSMVGDGDVELTEQNTSEKNKAKKKSTQQRVSNET